MGYNLPSHHRQLDRIPGVTPRRDHAMTNYETGTLLTCGHEGCGCRVRIESECHCGDGSQPYRCTCGDELVAVG